MTSIPYSRIPNAIKEPVPFRLSITDSNLQDFKTLLRLSKIPSPTYETLLEDGKYGVSHKWMTAAKARWEGFDWRACEYRINSFPAFTSKVEIDLEGVGKQEFGIHFTGIFSEKVDAVPILLLHGWPGSFLEFLPIMDLCRKEFTPQTLPYHLIVPSLPGYPLSTSAPLDREFGMMELPQIFNQLMLDLGFGSGYVAQGGDIGSRVARLLAVNYDACKAAHLNFCPIVPPQNFDEDALSPIEKAARARGAEFAERGRAYQAMHATRPGTLGLILGSSPLALLAWVGEKFLEWSDVSPDLDTILEIVTLYWFTEYGGKSVYPYRQKTPTGRTSADTPGAPEYYIKKPLGYSLFAKEIVGSPKDWVALSGNLVFHREHEKGGHFAALEQPELLKKDLEEFVKQVWIK